MFHVGVAVTEYPNREDDTMENSYVYAVVSGARDLHGSPESEYDCAMALCIIEDPESFEEAMVPLEADASSGTVTDNLCRKALELTAFHVSEVFYIRDRMTGPVSNVFELRYRYLRMIQPLADVLAGRYGSRNPVVVDVSEDRDVPEYWIEREFQQNRFGKASICHVFDYECEPRVWVADCFAFALDRMLNHGDGSLIGLYKGRLMECHPYAEMI